MAASEPKPDPRNVAEDTLTAILLQPNETHNGVLAEAQLTAARIMLAHNIKPDVVIDTLAAIAAGKRVFGPLGRVQAAELLLKELTK